VIEFFDDSGIVGNNLEIRHAGAGGRIDCADFNDRQCPFGKIAQLRHRLNTVLDFRGVKNAFEQRLGRRIALPRRVTNVGGIAGQRHEGVGRLIDGGRRAGIKGERSTTTELTILIGRVAEAVRHIGKLKEILAQMELRR
jgi:hypothetical protein